MADERAPAADALPEAELNRALRRVDWRFLLPRLPRRAVCFATGELARALELVVPDIVFAPAEVTAACDLAVVVDPDRATLRAAWDALEPGGVCYSEWSSRLGGGLAGARRRLEAARFSAVAGYWPWPSPGRGETQFWLPLDSTAALRYFLATRPRPRSRRLRVRNAALRVLWRLARRARLLAPVCALALKPGARPPGDRLRAQWSGWGLGAAPERLSWLLLTGGRRSVNKAVGLVFADEQREPSLTVKFARVPAAAAGLEREAASLRAVAAARAGGVVGVPRVVFVERSADTLVLGETPLGGRPLSTLLRPDTFLPLALQATEWLAGLAAATGRPRADARARLVDEPLERFEASFRDVLERTERRRAREQLASIPELRLVCEQRDFAPWNLLVGEDGELAVLDWESAEPEGLPGLDLVYFLTYAAFFVEGVLRSGRYRDVYRETMNASTRTGAVVRQCEQRYAEAVGLDPELLGPLRLLTWVVHSDSEHSRLAADSAAPPPAAALGGALFLLFWREELARTEVG